MPQRTPRLPEPKYTKLSSTYDAAYERRRGFPPERGYDHKWRRLRAAFLRLHPLCAHCPTPTPATDVDHITPHLGQSDPLFWAWENLQALCHSCHSRKTNRQRAKNWGGKKSTMFPNLPVGSLQKIPPNRL